jgi:hypothetical protein
MGAYELTMVLNGELTQDQVEKAYYERKQDDEYWHGCDPYNGTFTTMNGIKFRQRTFDSERDATEYILDNTEKWGDALAVKFTREGKTFWLVGGWAAS